MHEPDENRPAAVESIVGLATTAMNDGNAGDGARRKHTENRRVT
jgi:hypothetical protein